MSVPAWSSGPRGDDRSDISSTADYRWNADVAWRNGPYAPVGIGSGGPFGSPMPAFTEGQLAAALEAGGTCATIAAASGVGAASIPAVVAICGALQLSGVPIQQKAQQLYQYIRGYL